MTDLPYDPATDAWRPVCDVQASGVIELYFYDELTPAERSDVGAHVRGCLECRQALEDLELIRTALATRPDIASPPGGDWTGFMTRLEAAVSATDRDAPRLVAAGPSRSAGGAALWLAAAALLTLVTTGVVSVIRHQSPGLPETTPTVRLTDERRASDAPMPAMLAPASPAPGAARFATVSGEHFERSKLVILGLATKDAVTASASDWAYERQLASSLLDDTRIYRQAAAERGMDSLAAVMSDLELVLLQTSLSDMRDTATLDRLQRLIRTRDLVTKMEVVEGF